MDRTDINGQPTDSWFTSKEIIPLVETFDEWIAFFPFYLTSADFAPQRMTEVTERLVGLLYDSGFDPMPVWDAYSALETVLDLPEQYRRPNGPKQTEDQIQAAFRRAHLTYLLVLRTGVTTDSRKPKVSGRPHDPEVHKRRMATIQLVKESPKLKPRMIVDQLIYQGHKFATANLVSKDLKWAQDNGFLAASDSVTE